jgi:phosphatidylserine/phosphatidylglycerophosphate/cardiolipin synthase-like enzyme
VDDRLVVVGSINLDFLSMEYLEEGSLVVDDPEFAAEFEERWRVDISRSRQMTGQQNPASARVRTGFEGGTSAIRRMAAPARGPEGREPVPRW